MTTTSASRVDGRPVSPAGTTSARTILVWDLPVRVFHWMMVACFAGAWLTAETERWRLVHVSLGYGLAALVLFRVLWGLVGTRHARFASFVRGPSAVLRYLKSLTGPRPEHHTGHNPAGGWAILALLALAAVVVGTGWANYQDLGGEWLEEIHEGAATAMLAVVGLHVGGVIVSSWLHRQNLVRAMVTGRKPAAADQGIRSSWVSVAAVLLAAVIGVMAWSWSSAPGSAGSGLPSGAAQLGDDHDDDD
jgi:cytochrome b